MEMLQIQAFPRCFSPSFAPAKHRFRRCSSYRAIVSVKVSAESGLSLKIKEKASGISADLKGTSLFLVGVNSSYKSSLARILADSLRYYYFDSDDLVEEAAGGKSVALSFLERDEAGYLALETEVLKQLSSMGRLVVNAGNGSVKTAENLALLRHGITVWIDVPLDLVVSDLNEDRIQLSVSDMAATRSSSSSDVLTQLTALYNHAQPGYSTADATLSLQRVGLELGRDELIGVTPEDLCIEVR
ncbi:hypothetical protein M569_03405 [Genlisea aurea]|uniref:Shikimate kinase n=1 Tax=Genlisea aurea TaxID=192259 RepID=S8E6B5_9LAMI|nr:hypothetical protein M569_03405 [Genlisea aurea]